MAYDDDGGAQNDYLNAPDTAGRPMALMSLIVVFLVIAAIALALFAGGRWLYNEYANSDDQDSNDVATSQDVQNTESTEGESGDSSSTEGESSDSSSETNTSDGSGEQSAEGNGSEGNGEDSTNGSTDSSEQSSGNTANDDTNGRSSTEGSGTDNSGTEEQSAANTAVTGPSDSEEVPNTGPESLLALFIGATVIGTLTHRKWLVNRI